MSQKCQNSIAVSMFLQCQEKLCPVLLTRAVASQILFVADSKCKTMAYMMNAAQPVYYLVSFL